MIAMPRPRATRLATVPRPSNSDGTGGVSPTAASSRSVACRDGSPDGAASHDSLRSARRSTGRSGSAAGWSRRDHEHQGVADQVVVAEHALAVVGAVASPSMLAWPGGWQRADMPAGPVVHDRHLDLAGADQLQALGRVGLPQQQRQLAGALAANGRARARTRPRRTGTRSPRRALTAAAACADRSDSASSTMARIRSACTASLRPASVSPALRAVRSSSGVPASCSRTASC